MGYIVPGGVSCVLWSVRARFGFYDVPWEEARGPMREDAFQSAIAAYLEGGRPFLQCLQNAFRDLCREYRRRRGLTLIQGLCEHWELDMVSAIARGSAAPEVSPAESVARDEMIQLVVGLLRQEDRLCQRIMLMWARGSTDKEIEQHLGRDARECKNIRWRNIRRIQRALPLS